MASRLSKAARKSANGQNPTQNPTLRQRKKLCLPSEAVYVLATVVLALSVAMITSTDFGVSMIVAPAYLLSLKVGFLSFGQAEYVIQALLFAAFCIVMRGFKVCWLFSFFTGVFYGAVLDLFRAVIPHFNPSVTPPGSLPAAVRVIYFAVGMLLTSFSVSLFFKTYLYPQTYDFFVKGVSERFGLNRVKVKTTFDISCLAVAAALTFIFFGKIRGIGIGTVIMAAINGTIIGLFGKLEDKILDVKPLFPRFAERFKL